MDIYLTGALASEGVVEGAVEEAGVRMVLLGATPCLAHRILCLWPGNGGKVKYGGDFCRRTIVIDNLLKHLFKEIFEINCV